MQKECFLVFRKEPPISGFFCFSSFLLSFNNNNKKDQLIGMREGQEFIQLKK